MIRAFTAADTEAAMRLYRQLVGEGALAEPQAFAALLGHPGTTVLGD